MLIKVLFLLPILILVTTSALAEKKELPDFTNAFSFKNIESFKIENSKKKNISNSEKLQNTPLVNVNGRYVIVPQLDGEQATSSIERDVFKSYERMSNKPKSSSKVEFKDDTFIQKDYKSSKSSANPDEDDYKARKLQGKILINVFFMESKEGVAGEHEDWSSSEIADHLNTYALLLAGMASSAPKNSNLSFDLKSYIVPANGEPTANQGYTPYNALNDIVSFIGAPAYYPPDCPDCTSVYWRLDWTTNFGDYEHQSSITVVRDELPPFQSGGCDEWWPCAGIGGNTAHINTSYWGGDSVFAHELLHTFYAYDQYGDQCKLVNGNTIWENEKRVIDAGALQNQDGLYVINGNAVGCNFHSNKTPDIMNNNSLANSPYPRPLMSWYTRAQIGWGNTGTIYINHVGIDNSDKQLLKPLINLNGQLEKNFEKFEYLAPGEYNISSPYFYPVNPLSGYIKNTPCPFTINIQGSPNDIEDQTKLLFDSGELTNEGKVFRTELQYKKSDKPHYLPSCIDPPKDL